MTERETPGQVITFYSYKGGTGRSMALSNIACLLAQRQSLAEGKGVLLIDWDLEAPGLHRYFRDKFRSTLDGNENGSLHPSKEYEHKLDLQLGLIDLFLELDKETSALEMRETEGMDDDEREPQDEEAARAIIEKVNPQKFILQADVPSLYLMKAGRFDEEYATHVSKFQWEALYNRSPWMIRSLAEYLAEHFQYVIIDSRTGITDISGICTMLFPEKLVVVFTPNRQSLLGVQELVRRATKYRRQSDDLRPLAVFPLPSRIEATEPALRDSWRLGDEKQDIPGYQPLFEKLFEEVYDLADCDLHKYFDEVQIQHAPSYSYGENVSVLLEKSAGRLSLRQSFETVVDWLINHPVAWEQEQQARAAQEVSSDQMKLAEGTFARLSPDQQAATRSLFTRLVRLARPEEGGDDTRQRLRFSELSEAEQAVAEEWAKARLLVIQHDEHSSDKTVEPQSESLIREWKRLRTWLDEDRELLLWRQSLRADIAKWESAKRQSHALLVGSPLAEAKRRMNEFPSLSELEKSFINESVNQQLRLEKRKLLVVAAIVALLLIASLVGYGLWRRQQQRQEQEKINVQRAANLLIKGRAYADTAEYDSAIKAFDEAIQLQADLPEAFYERGLAYDNKGDRVRSISDYNQAIKLKPDFAIAYVKRGTAYYYQGNSESAMADYARAIEIQPDIAEAYYVRGSVYNEQKNFTAALNDFNQAIKVKPDYLEAMYARGIAYAVTGNIDAASYDLLKVRDQVTDPTLSRRADESLRNLKEIAKSASPTPAPSTPTPSGGDATPLADSLEGLVKQMNADSANVRKKAVAALLSSYKSSSQAVSLTLSLYDEGSINSLPPGAIVNGFYFLNRTTPAAWNSAQIELGTKAAARAELLGVGADASREIASFRIFLQKLKGGAAQTY